MNKLDQLREMTVIVADTGELTEIEGLKPQDATTNPSLLLKTAKDPKSGFMLDKAIATCDGSVKDAADRFAVIVGKEILNLIPGRVSTEVDAHLSFDVDAMLAKARKIIDLYSLQDISKERVLIKVAATWEGIQAAKILQQEGINCNLTLLFNFTQAVACAQANVFLISPFVGRILDWHIAKGAQQFKPDDDPGVASVTEIYAYYKTHGYNTIVMAASFRSAAQITALAGCDYLTIGPQLLVELSQDAGTLQQRLSNKAKSTQGKIETLSEQQFRWQLNQDAMASDKLAEGIRAFAADQLKLETLITNMQTS